MEGRTRIPTGAWAIFFDDLRPEDWAALEAHCPGFAHDSITPLGISPAEQEAAAALQGLRDIIPAAGPLLAAAVPDTSHVPEWAWLASKGGFKLHAVWISPAELASGKRAACGLAPGVWGVTHWSEEERCNRCRTKLGLPVPVRYGTRTPG